MTAPRHLRLLLAVAFCGLFLGNMDVIHAQKKDDKKAGNSSKSKKKKSKDAGPLPLSAQIAKMLPLGETLERVRLPNFLDSKIESMLIAATMTRVDDENIDMTEIEIHRFTPAGELEAIIDMTTGRYHVPSGILTSAEPTKITRQDLVLKGECMIFDIKASQGKMLGKTRMFIYESDEKDESTIKPVEDPETPQLAAGEASPYDPLGDFDWFYVLDGIQEGPVSTGRIKELIRRDDLKHQDLIWREGFVEWTAAVKVNGLFGIVKAPAQPAATEEKTGEQTN